MTRPSTSQSLRLCLLTVSLSAVLFLQAADAYVVRPSTGGQTPLEWKEVTRAVDDLTKTTSNQKQARGLSSKEGAKERTLPNVFYATTPEECQSIAEEHLDKLTVFRFSSKMCLACKYAAPRFDRMAAQAAAAADDHEDEQPLNFVFVDVTERNRDFVVRGLGIPALPYAGLFHPELGMVETASVKNAALFREFAAKVDTYRKNECLVSYDEDEETGRIECRPAVEKVRQ